MTRRLGWLIVVLGIGLFLPSQVPAATITFDDVGCGNECAIPDGYSGLEWDNFWVLRTSIITQDSGYVRGLVSGDFVGFNAFANPSAFLSATPVNFLSAYLTAAHNTGLNITVKGFLGATELYSQTVVVDDDAPTLFNFNYYGVDSVTFASFGGVDAGTPGVGAHFAIDDVTYNAVPEPSTLLLMGSGVLAGVRRMRARCKQLRSRLGQS